MSRLRIGLFGGSFDPIHLGHSTVAKAACDTLSLDQLYFIPNAQSVDEKALQANAMARLAMCDLVAQHDPRWEVCDFESKQHQAVYSYDTITYFHHQYPDASLYWIIGADRALDFPQWFQADQILALANLVIYPRDAITLPHSLDIHGHHCPIQNITPASLELTHGQILAMGKEHLPIAVSSTELRHELMQAVGIPNPYIEANVMDYIIDHQLYHFNLREAHHD